MTGYDARLVRGTPPQEDITQRLSPLAGSIPSKKYCQEYMLVPLFKYSVICIGIAGNISGGAIMSWFLHVA